MKVEMDGTTKFILILFAIISIVVSQIVRMANELNFVKIETLGMLALILIVAILDLMLFCYIIELYRNGGK